MQRVRIERPAWGEWSETLTKMRTWLDQQGVEPVLFTTRRDGRKAVFDVCFNSAEAAASFLAAFAEGGGTGEGEGRTR